MNQIQQTARILVCLAVLVVASHFCRPTYSQSQAPQVDQQRLYDLTMLVDATFNKIPSRILGIGDGEKNLRQSRDRIRQFADREQRAKGL